MVVHPKTSVLGVRQTTLATPSQTPFPKTAGVSYSNHLVLAISFLVCPSRIVLRLSSLTSLISASIHFLDTFKTENVVVGNLVVRADPTFGGGELNISGEYFYSASVY